jgi:hypothetical protein
VIQGLRSGILVMAISLALVGAAVTSQDPAETPQPTLGSSAVTVSEAAAAEARVPFRSASLEAQAAASGRNDGLTPVAVRIAGIGLQATVLSVGVDADNQFAVPEAEAVGWYKYGAAPGEAGSTVLAAHVDYGGRPGAFFHLADLTVGEILEVELAGGAVMQYRVTANILYDKTELPADELFRKGGEPVLQLITCGGTFDQTRRSYRGTVVVTAEPLDA